MNGKLKRIMAMETRRSRVTNVTRSAQKASLPVISNLTTDAVDFLCKCRAAGMVDLAAVDIVGALFNVPQGMESADTS